MAIKKKITQTKFKRLALLIVLIITAFSAATQAQNSIIQTKFTADPAPMVYKGTVYLYAGHDDDNASGFLMKDWLLYTSTDMVNWTDHGPVADLSYFKWAQAGRNGFKNGAWAAQCIKRNGKFYLYCTVEGRGIGVLVSDSPYGPFKDPIGKPLIAAASDNIDPTVLIDDDGQAYLYWGNPNLWYVKLNKDMVSYSGEPVKDQLIRKVKGQPDPFHYQEGPWVYKRDGHYYNAYASTCCPEGLGYAMSNSPLGPWEFKGYIMKPDKRSNGNHPGIIDYKGKSYVFGFNYELNFAQGTKHRERRSICAAELKYNPDGTIRELPWWNEGEALKPVGSLNPYKRTEAETIAWSEGIKTLRNEQVGMYVTSVENNDYIRIKAVDFKKGAKSFQMQAASLKGGKVELRLDGRYGLLIGVCEADMSDAPESWKTYQTQVKKVKGVHDLYLVFTGEEGEQLFNFDHWKFEK
jgi:arabinoxylan arabinofuranohydrolase